MTEKDDIVQCTIYNSKKFAEKFIESQKGRGNYVDSLSKSKPYVFVLPSKMDFVETTYNPRDPSDPNYNAMETRTDRVYSYVEMKYSHPEDPDDPARPLGYDWTATGQRDWLKARSAAADRDERDQKLRDETV